MVINAPVFVRLHLKRMIGLETDEESCIPNSTRPCFVKLSSRDRTFKSPTKMCCLKEAIRYCARRR